MINFRKVMRESFLFRRTTPNMGMVQASSETRHFDSSKDAEVFKFSFEMGFTKAIPRREMINRPPAADDLVMKARTEAADFIHALVYKPVADEIEPIIRQLWEQGLEDTQAAKDLRALQLKLLGQE